MSMMSIATVRNIAWQTLIGVICIAAVTLICFPLHLNFAIPAFLYLLAVVLRSPSSGFAPVAIVSLVAVLCLDYFFTPPILQLEVASPIDAAALLAYLITSLIITRLATDARRKARWAEGRQETLV
jgi:two-component system sensor histidine kinase KdpD